MKTVSRLVLASTLLIVVLASGSAAPGPRGVPDKPQLDACFRLMYELKFETARSQIDDYQKTSPSDALGAVAEAASFLFEQFNHKGVLTSKFFLDDDRLLGGIEGTPDARLSAAFLDAIQRGRRLALASLDVNPQDPEALLALTLTYGMQADFQAVIERRQMASLSLIRRAEDVARDLLKVQPDNGDAYVALGMANYIIGSMPGYKRFFLRLGGIKGSRERGVEQLQVAATRGHYLKPLAKAILALAAERENQPERARRLFSDSNREFPDNAVFARELALLTRR